jgi:pterin-4a-carbinolamine dehydratase
MITSEPNIPLTLLTSCPSVYGRILRLGPRAILMRPLQYRNAWIHLHPRAFFDACHSHDRAPYASRSFTTSQPSTSSDTANVASNRFTGVIFSAEQPSDLPQRLTKLSDWKLSPSNKGISRQFTFSGFAPAWRFMSIVADECKTKRHHPSWHNLYSQVTIEWTTHKPEGLSIKDVEMAEFCDQTADNIGLKK